MPTTYTCPRCQAPIRIGQKFCKHCGLALDPASIRTFLAQQPTRRIAPATQASQTERRPTRPSLGRLAIGCVGIFLLCSVLAALGQPHDTGTLRANANADPAKSLSVLTRIPATATSQHAAAAQADAGKAAPTGGQDTLQETPTPLPRSGAATAMPPTAKVAAGDVATGRVAGTVSRVVDGDTIDVTFSGRAARVRLIGMDTPETKHPSKPVMCFGAEATVKTQQLIDQAGGRVLLEKDLSETDQYGRLLRYVWLPLPGGEVMLNEVLVDQGYAQVSTYPPDVKYQDRFLAAQRVAREQNRGLWAACGSFDVPAASPTEAAARVPATATSAPVVRALPTATAKPVVRSRPTATVAPTAPANAAGTGQSGTGPVISYVYYDGQEYRSEGDEYAVIKNPTSKSIDLRGYTLNAGDSGQDFTFPAFTLKPNATVRVYTNRNIAGSFSFDSGRALWNNKGDCGYLYDPRGKQVSDYCY